MPWRSRKSRLLLLAALPIATLAVGMITTISCQSIPVILTSRSDAAAEQLRAELVLQDGRVIEMWSGPLGPDDWRIIHVPLLVDGFYHEGHLRYGGFRADGEPIPEASGPGYLSAFPNNEAAIFVLGKDETTAMAVGEWVFPEQGNSGLLLAGWVADQFVIVLSCWWKWIAGPVGFAVMAGIAALAALAAGWAWRRRKTVGSMIQER